MLLAKENNGILVCSNPKAMMVKAKEYGLVDEINYLKSGRIGYNHKKVDLFNSLLSDVSFYDASHNVDDINYQPKSFPFDKEIDQSYLFEHGFTTSQLMSGIVVALAGSRWGAIF